MITDFEILGVNSNASVSEIKSSFRKKIKELHPDSCKEEESLQRHLLFIETCNAYKRLLGNNTQISKVKQPSNSQKKNNNKEVIIHSDQAYVFYRTGIKYFGMIHPNSWNINGTAFINTRIAGKDEDQIDIQKRIMELTKLFPKAYYYFSIVVHEYPNSEWASDAREKMVKIENRTKMYKKIIESFSIWNKNVNSNK